MREFIYTRACNVVGWDDKLIHESECNPYFFVLHLSNNFDIQSSIFLWKQVALSA